MDREQQRDRKKQSKRQEIREQRMRQQRKQTLIWSGAGLVVIVLIGVFVWQGSAQGSLGPVGVSVAVSPEYSTHIEEGADPGPFPTDPPAGGRHYGSDLEAGFYDDAYAATLGEFPEGYLVHNLEHGYVIFWYNCDLLSPEACEALKSDIRKVMDKFGGSELIAFPWKSLDVPVAMTSWDRLQRFESFDPTLAERFIRANQNKSPEAGAG